MSMVEIDIGPLVPTRRWLNDLFERCVQKEILTPEGAQELRKEL